MLAVPTLRYPTMMMMNGSSNFYSDLPVLLEFADITNAAHFVSVPEDWFVIVTDVVNSTRAVEQGRYREVNLVGASTIVSLLNLDKHIDLPFVFGGDGAEILIPSCLVDSARSSLMELRSMIAQQFNLDLRVGFVPVGDIYPLLELKIAKLQVSPNYHQAIFRGGGLTHATNLVKQEQSIYQIHGSFVRESIEEATGLNLAGLECRWQDIPSPHDEVLTLIVSPFGSTDAITTDLMFSQAITQIINIYGEDAQHCPVTINNLSLSFQDSKLMGETKMQTAIQPTSAISQQLGKLFAMFNPEITPKVIDEFFYLCRIKLENLLGNLLISLKIKTKAIDWSEYKHIVIAATDYKKFDDALRMVLAGNCDQRHQLLNYLESQYQQEKLTYGYHVSDRSLMTCLVFARGGQQVHFIDGADGGYTYAARTLKQRLKTKGKEVGC